MRLIIGASAIAAFGLAACSGPDGGTSAGLAAGAGPSGEIMAQSDSAGGSATADRSSAGAPVPNDTSAARDRLLLDLDQGDMDILARPQPDQAAPSAGGETVQNGDDRDETEPVQSAALRAASARPPRPDTPDDNDDGRKDGAQSDQICQANCCTAKGGAVMNLTVTNVKSAAGNVRVTVYPGEKAKFLEKGMGIVKVDVPSQSKTTDVCVPLPGQGQYTIAVMHDRDADGKADKFSEGFGFSNNAKFMFGPPSFDDAVFSVDGQGTSMSIRLKYPFG